MKTALASVARHAAAFTTFSYLNLGDLKPVLTGATSASTRASQWWSRRIPHIQSVGASRCGHSKVEAHIDPLSRIRAAVDQEVAAEKMLGAAAASCRLVFLGGPGVGKGTYASLLSKRLGIPHISTGDLVRAELSKPPSTEPEASLLYEKVREAVNQGKLLSDEIVVELLSNRLGHVEPSVGYILDGFPRTLSQARVLDEAVGGVDMAVNLRLREDVLVAKCLGRRVCSECGKDFNLAHVDIPPDGKKGLQDRIILPARLPPPACASKLRAREDDTKEEAVRERLRVHAREIEPLEQHYRTQGKLLDLDVGRGIEDAWPRLLDAALELNDSTSNNIAASY